MRAAVLVLLLTLTGCESPPPEFPPALAFPPRRDRIVLKLPDRPPAGMGDPSRIDDDIAGLDALGGRTIDPAAAEGRDALDQYLAEAFGTPASPRVAGDSAWLGLTAEKLAEGGRLYRRHCLQCHGLSGDGRGPTGLWILPHPRDFRRGSFKFTSTGEGGKPRRADLLRTIASGLKGTAMPSFAMLPPEQREILAEFVIFVSLRGQTEYQTLAMLADGPEPDVAGYARERLAVAVKEWAKAEEAPQPLVRSSVMDERESPEHYDAVRRGFDLFVKKDGAGCASCHEDFGRKAAYKYDVWGTVVRPAELTANTYKGGGRPEDFYQRIRSGIAPAGMPAHPNLSDGQVWDLVRFVRSVPFPRELPPDVREKVYPK